MKRTYVFRNGRMIEVNPADIPSRKDQTDRIMATGTQGQRILEAYRLVESQKGSAAGFADDHRTVKRIWAEQK